MRFCVDLFVGLFGRGASRPPGTPNKISELFRRGSCCPRRNGLSARRWTLERVRKVCTLPGTVRRLAGSRVVFLHFLIDPSARQTEVQVFACSHLLGLPVESTHPRLLAPNAVDHPLRAGPGTLEFSQFRRGSPAGRLLCRNLLCFSRSVFEISNCATASSSLRCASTRPRTGA